MVAPPLASPLFAFAVSSGASNYNDNEEEGDEEEGGRTGTLWPPLMQLSMQSSSNLVSSHMSGVPLFGRRALAAVVPR
jgi:hypothetical protein